MRKLLLLTAFSLISICSFGTHIVGGEFEITHIEGDRYLFRQIQYFDVVNGNPQAKDQLVSASIFRKRDNVFVRAVQMRLESEKLVSYTNPVCTDDRLITNRIVYSATVILDPRLFSDSEGYYMVWERCCRNNIITNIVNPEETGQTFYIEFPPIRKNGEVFRNSSPQLFPPLSDYACVNRFYYVDFRGSDPDGDSLVYSLETPSNSSAFEPLPTPTPAPHPTVTWSPGINSNFQIPGTPTLQINERGFLTVTPSEEGLFVFSVKCEEYRNGVKLGEVVRDFQLFVIDCPPPGNAPEIQVKGPKSDVFSTSVDTVVLKTEDDKCFDFQIKDRDGSETIRMRAEAVNFEANIQSILSTEIGILEDPEDTLGVQVCLPDCPYLQDEPFIIDIIAQDNTCPLPLMDTMRLYVLVEPPPNQGPRFTMPVEDNLVLTLVEGEEISIDFEAVDDDEDSLLLFVEALDFELASYGISIDTIEFVDGKINFALDWDTDCQKYPFAEKNEFELKLFVEDYDQCQLDNRDSITLNITVELPGNNDPEIFVDNSPDDKEIDIKVEDRLLYVVNAIDIDPTDSLFLRAVGTGFDIEDIGLVFEDQEGKIQVSTDFHLDVDCDLLDQLPQGKYEVLLIAEDGDKCKQTNADTLKLNFNVLPPVNDAPNLFINDEVSTDTIPIIAGTMANFEIVASDVNNDSIYVFIGGEESAGDLGVEFINTSGFGNVMTPFTWQTTCSNLGDDFASQYYSFSIIAQDFKCAVPKSDTLDFTLQVVDKEVDFNFLPPNVFTPNAEDDINESFYVPDLPGDNCRRQFQEVKIFNRLGKEVFISNNRDFNWYGTDHPTGVYFYLISYTDQSVKGTISLLR